MSNKLYLILFLISILIIIATIFCFGQPEQVIAQRTTTNSVQSMVMNKSTTQQQHNISLLGTND
ncbi:MAG: hypothetical protein ACTHKF_04345, partial [Candidatus Nitrosocosmicus sp.]